MSVPPRPEIRTSLESGIGPSAGEHKPPVAPVKTTADAEPAKSENFSSATDEASSASGPKADVARCESGMGSERSRSEDDLEYAAAGARILRRLVPATDKGAGYRRDPETGFVFYSSEWLSDAAATRRLRVVK